MMNLNAKLKEKENMEPYKITRPGEPYQGPHIGPRLTEKLDTHRWHVLRIRFVDEPQLETYEAVVAAKTVTPKAIKELLEKAWCDFDTLNWPHSIL